MDIAYRAPDNECECETPEDRNQSFFGTKK